MAEQYLVKKSDLDDIANSIQSKAGVSGGLVFPEGFKSVVENIPTGGDDSKFAQVVDGTITEVTEQDLRGATAIKDRVFEKCKSLTDVTIPSSVLSIGQYAFSDCTILTTAHLSNGLTSIGQYAFKNCNKLTSIELPDSLTKMENFVFQDCSSLASATVSKGLTSLPAGIFKNCKALATIKLPDTLTSIGGDAFYYCAFVSIDLPDSLATISDGAFYYCSNLESIEFPNGLTSIGSSFRGCRSLTSLEFPESLTKIAASAFRECGKLKTVTFKGTPTSLASNVFYSNTSIQNIYVPWAEGEVANAPWGATNATIHYGTTKYTTTVGTAVSAELSFYTPDDVANIYLEYPDGTKVDVGVYGDNFPSTIASGISSTGDSYTEGDVVYIGYSWGINSYTFNTAGAYLIYGESASGEKTQIYKFVVS